MRRPTAVSIGPPWFFVNVASKGFRLTVGARVWREGRPVLETAFGGPTHPVGLPPFFVNVASKGFKFTVGARLWREGRQVVETASREAAHFVGARHAVPVLPATATRFVGAQFIAPFSPKPFPKRQRLMPTNLPQGAPKP
jgi:hypothetical protein